MKFKTLIAICVSSLLVACANIDDHAVNSGVASEIEYSFDGLGLSGQGDFDSVYLKPNIDLKAYNNVMLMPGDVSFQKKLGS